MAERFTRYMLAEIELLMEQNAQRRADAREHCDYPDILRELELNHARIDAWHKQILTVLESIIEHQS